MADRRSEDRAGADDRSWMDRCADDELGGRGHHRGRGPKDWSRDDQRLYEEVCERLLHDRLIDARGIEVEVEDGVVTLRGEARGASDPALALRLVHETPGVKGVEIDLKVNPNSPRFLTPAKAEDDDGRTDKSPMGYPILPT
ncbi:BON domain-containing protein [Phenylobacterium sp.]|uniref:BON domain-containing protein n=1 Tax=Phenylobacterium sp. TaxID=1871053 RepID=UPI002DEBA4E1|nr:BON domain-containing protein [Phenylobacterium sp.]